MRRAATVVLALGIFWWAWPPSGPTFKVGGGTEVYPCRRGAEQLPVRFSSDGMVAEVRFRGRTYHLPYVGNGIMEDVYAADGWRLTIDPEANWYGPNGLHLICTW